MAKRSGTFTLKDSPLGKEAGISGRRRLIYQALIFTTGAVVLSLEVLASRIMTPYFGISLYIWAGVLSITLTFLALGYHLGGRLSQNRSLEGLELLFLAAPLLSALSIVVACVLYPLIFPRLSVINLIMGSFVGGTLLLALPLVALSAMNPFLISMCRVSVSSGDAGAGKIFFISTVGSVAGVLLTAFVIIPALPNYRALLAIGLGLSLTVAGFAVCLTGLRLRWRAGLFVGSLISGLSCCVLLLYQSAFLDLFAKTVQRSYTLEVQAEYSSVFGNVKVVEIDRRNHEGASALAYVQDGTLLNLADPHGNSLSPYTYVLEQLAHTFVPNAKDSLVLGLAAGAVPKNLERRGHTVSVVEINPESLKAATEWFHFDPSSVSVYLEDARTFIRRHREAYEVIIVDASHGDGISDYLLTEEFFRDVRASLRPGGAMVMNFFFNHEDERPHRHLLATIRGAFENVLDFRAPRIAQGKPVGNAYIVAATGSIPAQIKPDLRDVPPLVREHITRTLASGRIIRQQSLAETKPVTDAHNIFSVLFATSQMALRKLAVEKWTPDVLIN